ncbi:MAG: DinB family protein [Gemmatimonadaceae bacterium]
MFHLSLRRGRRGATLAALASAVALVPNMLIAQKQQGSTDAAFDAKSAAHVRAAYLADMDTLHAKLMALATAIPADKYSWRPSAGVRSVSEVFMHVAGEWYHWAPASIGGKAPADFPTARDQLMAKLNGLEKTTAKDAVIAEMNKSWTHCRAQLASADPATLTGKYKPWGMTVDAAAFSMAGDLHEHLGQMIAYARSVGVTPPWSKKS